MRASVHACTRRSSRHAVNEDRAAVGAQVLSGTAVERASLSSPALVAVFDGVGGAPAGDLASELAARAICAADPPGDEAQVRALLERVDRLLVNAGGLDPSHSGMATTTAVLVLPEANGQAVVANVGDSIVARLDEDGLHEVSTSDRIGRRMIGQSLGGLGGHDLSPHVTALDLAAGDRLLLATDGLTDAVEHDMVDKILRQHTQDAAARLLEMVEQAGTPDDVTIVTVDIESD